MTEITSADEPAAENHSLVPIVMTDSAALPGLGIPALAHTVFRVLRRIRCGRIDVRLPDGRVLRFQGEESGPHGRVDLHNFRALRRVVLGGNIGFAEGYIAGDWTSPDLTAALQVAAANSASLQEMLRGQRWAWLAARILHHLRRNSPGGAKRNISFHYDLGNAFYGQWLDRTMTYSCARFGNDSDNLAQAQENKYFTLAERIELRPAHSVLEIGSGWGGFAEWAAKTIGCRVTGITISSEQLEFARKRIFGAGLADKVDFQFRDYRDVDGQFDRIVSIEMFEAVGEAYWPAFFAKLRDALVKSGRAGLQLITMADDLFPAYRRNTDFLQRYIFPGGMLPSPSVLRKRVAEAGLTFQNQVTFGQDYARTLALWRRRFLTAWPIIWPLGFDERFKRIWTYYLSYCEAGFRARTVDVAQIALARP